MPHLDYCQVLYNPCSRVLCEHLERIQNYAIRLITGNPPRTSSAPLRQNLGLTTLRARWQIATIIQVKHCLVGCAPPYMSGKFVTNSNFDYNQTRGANKLHLKGPNTNFYKHSFECKGAVLYNSLPESIRTIPNECSLRSALLSISDTFDQ